MHAAAQLHNWAFINQRAYRALDFSICWISVLGACKKNAFLQLKNIFFALPFLKPKTQEQKCEEWIFICSNVSWNPYLSRYQT